MKNLPAFGTAFLVFTLVAALGLAEKAGKQAAPRKLSDLQHFMTQQVEDLFGAAKIRAKTTIWGRSTEIIPTGRFRRVEMDLGGFDYNGLRFDKAYFNFEHLWVQPKSLARWEMQVDKVGEVTSRLVVGIPSLRAKLAPAYGEDFKIKPMVAEQQVELSGRSRLFFIPLSFATRAALRFDGTSLWLDAKEVRWAGVRLPSWLSWAGNACPRKPVLTLPSSWIPYNIQEIHLSWDKITLSTNW